GVERLTRAARRATTSLIRRAGTWVRIRTPRHHAFGGLDGLGYDPRNLDRHADPSPLIRAADHCTQSSSPERGHLGGVHDRHSHRRRGGCRRRPRRVPLTCWHEAYAELAPEYLAELDRGRPARIAFWTTKTPPWLAVDAGWIVGPDHAGPTADEHGLDPEVLRQVQGAVTGPDPRGGNEDAGPAAKRPTRRPEHPGSAAGQE